MSDTTPTPLATLSGQPFVTIVSGLPRAGTSLMMKMLEAGGRAMTTRGTQGDPTMWQESFPRRAFLNRVCLTLIVTTGLWMGALAIPGPSRADDRPAGERPFTVECYYRARWGYADEFIRLFRKNHLPVLKKLVEKGRILKISAVKPRYHGTEDGRWDYRVTIVFKDPVVAHDPSVEEAIKKQLFPDQETFKKEEQRRFEILQAHWDLPVEDVTLDE